MIRPCIPYKKLMQDLGAAQFHAALSAMHRVLGLVVALGPAVAPSRAAARHGAQAKRGRPTASSWLATKLSAAGGLVLTPDDAQRGRGCGVGHNRRRLGIHMDRYSASGPGPTRSSATTRAPAATTAACSACASAAMTSTTSPGRSKVASAV